MTVVHISAFRRQGGLRRDQVWVERAFPDRHWVIADVQVCEAGYRRVVIEPLDDRSSEAVYSESYFRRHFLDRNEWLRRENERLRRRAKTKPPVLLLHEMASINAPRYHLGSMRSPGSTS